ncbi:hypothetical protein CQA18_25080, partial [Enterobacter hormaechei]|uniref:hypothetical protein n=1 Tax=Enterobacter hormaechei TaxID=158836 RepID=UPI000BCD4FA7
KQKSRTQPPGEIKLWVSSDAKVCSGGYSFITSELADSARGKAIHVDPFVLQGKRGDSLAGKIKNKKAGRSRPAK